MTHKPSKPDADALLDRFAGQTTVAQQVRQWTLMCAIAKD